MGFDHGVAADHGVMGKEDGVGGDEGHAVIGQGGAGAGLEQRLGARGVRRGC